jgi:AcrR family transcriptional regulator
MPRGYAMERRRQQVAATRERILLAAWEIFGARGARGTTLAEVARRADVSPTTVSNHFETQEALLEAVIERLLEEVAVPDPGILQGLGSFPARVRAFTQAMFAFYERTNVWFRLLRDELTDVPAIAAADAEFRSRVGALLTATLGQRADERLYRVAGGLIHPATFNALREVGWSVEEAADLIADSVIRQAPHAPRVGRGG